MDKMTHRINPPLREECIKEIRALISNLELQHPDQHSIEGQALRRLIALLEAVEGQNGLQMDNCAAALKQFWLESVAWCSQLSKDLEKVLIIYEEGI
jgi:hypothetical protein